MTDPVITVTDAGEWVVSGSLPHSSASFARHAIERGWSPIPIPAGSKAPETGGWQHLRFSSPRQVTEAFGGETNVGLLLGAASGGLVDVDLDCDEAVSLSTLLLPVTPMVHGRPTNPRSHWWYVGDREIKTARYIDPVVQEAIKDRRRKGLPADPNLKAMMLELRSTGAQTIVPPSLHPDGDVLEWDDPDASPLPIASSRLELHVRVLAAATLLVRYWPASGQRHDATLALAGGLLRAGWTERNAAHLVCAIGSVVDPAVDRKDRVDAVKSTAERLSKDLPTGGFPKLADLVGTLVVNQVREWLALEADDPDDPDSGLQRSRLGALLRDGVPDPEWLLEDVLYAQGIHWISGEPGKGKTIFMLGLAVHLMKQGKTVMWVDEEAGLIQTARRLGYYGLDPDLADERFFYFDRPAITMSEPDLHALFQRATEIEPDMVVFDSVADMLVQAGLEEDNNSEVSGWAKGVLEPLKFQHHAAVVVLDHVTKSKDSRGGWSRGAGAKKGKTDVQWALDQAKVFDVNTMGILTLTQNKDREGYAPRNIVYKIGGQGGKTILERTETVKQESKPPTEGVEGQVAEFLQLNADSEPNAVTTTAVRSAVPGRGSTITEALEAMAADPETGVRRQERGRTSYWWFEDAGFTIDFGGVE